MGTADVRGDSLRTTVITLLGFGAGDEFKLRAYAQGVDGDFAGTDTIAFTHGTDAASTDLQTALRTATGDASLTVSGTTDSGPFTVTYVAKKGQPELVAHSITGGAAVQISHGALAYDDPATQSSSVYNGIVFDPESSRGFGADVPLGHSIVTDGTGQTRGTTLAPPTAVTASSGDSGATTIDTTEVSSGGTSAEVLYAVLPLEGGDPVVVDNQDADGDLTISGLAAGNYVVLAHTVTANGRVSRPWAPVYITVAA
jgi:hypothetical protein